MYSGTTFNKTSGRVIGVHQKINRAAYRLVKNELSGFFPELKHIQHFEGKNGPDGIKRKNPGADEPWHFIDPQDIEDKKLLEDIRDHLHNLSIALKSHDTIRSGFEAAWLAHAVVDGLTPAHHFPLEEHLEGVRGEGLETRNSVRKKLIIPGGSRREKIKNNWEFWGAKGVMTSHVLFELGVVGAVTPFPAKITLSLGDIHRLKSKGFEVLFQQAMQDIASLEMYEIFIRKGWTQSLARQTKKELVPRITKLVALAWLEATYED